MFTVNKKVLLTAVENASKFAGKKCTIPQYNNVCLELQEGILCVRSTNADKAFETAIAIDTDDYFFISVDGKQLLSAIKASKEADTIVDYVKDDSCISINNMRLSCATVDMWELLDSNVLQANFEINAAELQAALKEVVTFSAKNDMLSPVLQSVRVEMSENGVLLVASDGMRVTTKSIILDRVIKFEPVNLPADFVTSFVKSKLCNKNDVASVYIGREYAEIVVDDNKFSTKMLGGKYIDHARVCNEKRGNHVTVNAAELKQELLACKSLVKPNMRVGVIVRITENALDLYIKTVSGEYETSISATTNDFISNTIVGLNPSFMLDVCNINSSDTITIDYIDGKSNMPVSVHTDDKTISVIVPVHVDNNHAFKDVVKSTPAIVAEDKPSTKQPNTVANMTDPAKVVEIVENTSEPAIVGDESALYEVTACSSAVLSFEFNYKKAKGKAAAERLITRINKFCEREDISGNITIAYGEPHRTKEHVVIAVGTPRTEIAQCKEQIPPEPIKDNTVVSISCTITHTHAVYSGLCTSIKSFTRNSRNALQRVTVGIIGNITKGGHLRGQIPLKSPPKIHYSYTLTKRIMPVNNNSP